MSTLASLLQNGHLKFPLNKSSDGGEIIISRGDHDDCVSISIYSNGFPGRTVELPLYALFDMAAEYLRAALTELGFHQYPLDSFDTLIKELRAVPKEVYTIPNEKQNNNPDRPKQPRLSAELPAAELSVSPSTVRWTNNGWTVTDVHGISTSNWPTEESNTPVPDGGAISPQGNSVPADTEIAAAQRAALDRILGRRPADQRPPRPDAPPRRRRV